MPVLHIFDEHWHTSCEWDARSHRILSSPVRPVTLDSNNFLAFTPVTSNPPPIEGTDVHPGVPFSRRSAGVICVAGDGTPNPPPEETGPRCRFRMEYDVRDEPFTQELWFGSGSWGGGPWFVGGLGKKRNAVRPGMQELFVGRMPGIQERLLKGLKLVYRSSFNEASEQIN